MFGLICYAIDHGVPFDVAHAMGQWELVAYFVRFARFENGDQEWDWDRMKFIEKR